MPDAFRTLASLLLKAEEALAGETPAGAEAAAATSDAQHSADGTGCAASTNHADPRVIDLFDRFLVELTRLSARAAERLEEQAESVLADLARRVLGRELRLSPADIDALLAQTLTDFAIVEPLVLRVSSADAERLTSPWPVRVDAALTAGDFAVDVDDGTYDLAFQTRLEAMLASHRIAL